MSSKKHWTEEEDANLMRLIPRYFDNKGRISWSKLCKYVGRNPKECRERYHNFLHPRLKKGKLVESDFERIFELYCEGYRMIDISNATDISASVIKNFIHSAKYKDMLKARFGNRVPANLKHRNSMLEDRKWLQELSKYRDVHVLRENIIQQYRDAKNTRFRIVSEKTRNLRSDTFRRAIEGTKEEPIRLDTQEVSTETVLDTTDNFLDADKKTDDEQSPRDEGDSRLTEGGERLFPFRLEDALYDFGSRIDISEEDVDFWSKVAGLGLDYQLHL